ncbi:MAG: impB/mucB/samB family protein [Alphaproteobacteria bacterium]|nr:impB/mucB/samB family protein [Alphaproteobacteria bacterium]
MRREPGFTWLFLDLDSYFASVEQQENPRLRGRPVAVVPMPTDYTCAIAASYEAKAYGVKTGTMIRDAKQMCPGLICVPARHDVYVAYHNRIIEEIIKHVPINTIWSIDEMSSRLPPLRRNIAAAKEISFAIKEGIKRNIGPAIGCSIGFAPNSLLAKIASDMNKPDGFKVLLQEDLPGDLLTLKLRDVPGIGAAMERRLLRAGIRSIEDLWATSPKQARRIWGSVQGERMWYWLHGYDFDAPETHPSMIGHSRILDPEMRAAESARQMARSLLVKASFRLRCKGLYAQKLSLSVRNTDDLRWGGERGFIAARDPFTFLQHMDILWSKMMHDFPYRSAHFKKVSVVLHGLCKEQEICGDLFAIPLPSSVRSIDKRAALTQALDTLREKYRGETVSLGVSPKTIGGYVGTKIAFARVPSQEEFWS